MLNRPFLKRDGDIGAAFEGERARFRKLDRAGDEMAGAARLIKDFPAVAIIEDDAEGTRLCGRAARPLIDELLEAGDMVARLFRLVSQPFELASMIEGEHRELVRPRPPCR